MQRNNSRTNKTLNRILTVLYILLPVCVFTLIAVLFNASKNNVSNIEEIKYEYNLNLNKGYFTDDIPDIEKVRDLFTCYLSSMNYSKFNNSEFDLIDAYSKSSELNVITQKLLSKYTEIKIDDKNILTFDGNSRYIIIKNGPCIFTTNINVDIPVNGNYYLFSESFVPTTNGTWCIYPNGLDNEFLFFSFGKQYKSRTIKSEHGGLTMLDKRYINNKYYTHSIDYPYDYDSKFYLFRSTDGKLFIYFVENKKWKSVLDYVKEIKIDDDFVIFIHLYDHFSVYCVKHSKLLVDKGWFTNDYLNDILLKHKKCNN